MLVLKTGPQVWGLRERWKEEGVFSEIGGGGLRVKGGVLARIKKGKGVQKQEHF